ncbi:hypothetical protein OC842_001347 [Tilletia horrida]|uniref:SET domain-containing protein n=1 Tax=Tilletia horrida TaxID=155126 RepID=A0AAN6GK25_9BASI|nr:hypothetical protein OC842_001347 [Tilletia horrida]
MEDLVRSLRTLGLRPPSGSLLVDLIEADADPEAQKRLADLLALEKLTTTNDDGEEDGGESDDEDVFITPDVVRGALLSLLDSFSRTLARARELHKREHAAYVAAVASSASSSVPVPAAAPDSETADKGTGQAKAKAKAKDKSKGGKAAAGGAMKVKPVPRAALLNRQSSDIRRAQEEYDALFAICTGTGEGRTNTKAAAAAADPQPIPRLILEGAPFFTSTTPLAQLERMGIADFQAPMHFRGRYLLCRIISAPLLYVGCTFIVDDPAGAATPLSIAHFTSRLNLRPGSPHLTALLPPGTILAIREPYVSTNHHVSAGGPILGKAATGVRVSSPTDVVVLEPGNEVLRGVEWKVGLAEVLGASSEVEAQVRPHKWMREGACSRLVRAQEQEQKQDTENWRPTAEATLAQLRDFLEESRPGAAYRELVAARQLGVLADPAQDGIGQDLVDLEARILHSLRAYCGLRALAERCQASGLSLPAEQRAILERAPAFRGTSSSSPSQEPTQALVQALYTLDRTPTESTPTPELYGQDYISPALAIAPIPGAGRGLLTTRDVAPGELLLCCTAVEPCFAEDERWAGVQVLRLGLSVEHAEGEEGDIVGAGAEGVSVTTTQVMACTRLVHALVDRPELCHAVLGLTAGPHTPDSSFARRETYPLVTEALLDPTQALEAYIRPNVDAKYVDGVLQHNAFGPGRDVDVDLSVPIPSPDSRASAEANGPKRSKRPRRPPPASADLARASMPHPLPAILNHRCIPNVSSVFLGSAILTRALIPLPHGTEIVHQYVSGERAFSIRSAHLSKHGFACACVLCVAERAEGREVVRRRVQVREGRMGGVVERARMLFKNRRAGLVRGPAEEGTEQEEREREEEAERDVGRAFEGIVEEIEATYDPARGSLDPPVSASASPGDRTAEDKVILKPELFDPLVMLARHHRRAAKTWWEAVQCEIKALRSVGALIHPAWICTNKDTALSRAIAEEPILKQAPVLRLVDSQRALLRIARTLRANEPNAPLALALRWVEASYALSTWMIGGGTEVFLDMMRRTREGDEWEVAPPPTSSEGSVQDGMMGEEALLKAWLLARR